MRRNDEGLEVIYNNPEPYLKSKKYQVHEDTEMYLRALVNRAKKKTHNVIVNPCVTGDTLVETDSGSIEIKELVRMYESGEACPLIQTYNTQTKENEYKELEWGGMTREDAELIQIENEQGKVLRCTPDHKVWTENRGYVEARHLVETDELRLA